MSQIRNDIIDQLAKIDPEGMTIARIAAALELDANCLRQTIYRLRDEAAPLIRAEKRFYFLTDRGRATARARLRNPGRDYSRWVREARTGIRTDGRRSSITRGAVPSHSQPRFESAIETLLDQKSEAEKGQQL